MERLPTLPEPGPLLVLVLSASLALVALLIPLIRGVWDRRWREAAWAAIPLLLLAGITAGASRMGGHLHGVLALTTTGFCLRNALVFRGLSRFASWAAVAGLLTALVSAAILF